MLKFRGHFFVEVRRVVCERKYHAGGESEEMLNKAGVSLEFFHDEVQKY